MSSLVTLMLITTGVFLSLSQCTDPGVIPRKWIQEILSKERERDFSYDPDPVRDLDSKVKMYEDIDRADR